MKTIIYFTIVILFLYAFDENKPCPIGGDKNNAKFQHVDSLKNRSVALSNINPNITLDSIFRSGDDSKRWSENDYANISGYIFNVKYGGAETCNCHSSNKNDLDIHIELVQDLKKSDGTKRMIVEINRFVKAKYSIYYDSVKLLIGKKVQISGYMFFDSEHKQNAINTSPSGTNLWRATCWEIHPCIFIKEIK